MAEKVNKNEKKVVKYLEMSDIFRIFV